MKRHEKKQFAGFARKLRRGLELQQVFVEDGIHDMDEESEASFQLQPGWPAAIALMAGWLSQESPIQDGSIKASATWKLLKEAEGFLKIAD